VGQDLATVAFTINIQMDQTALAAQQHVGRA
jgi:hypothetical protein